jgi:Tfp pilus assembly protein PilX
MNIKLLKQNKDKGYVAFFITILILSIMLGIAFSIVILSLNVEKISANIIRSSQAYYTAEAGIEDALLRFFDPTIAYSSSSTLLVGGATATTLINELSTSLTIESQGNYSNRIRKVKVEALVSSSGANFYYGVQVGEGGLTMLGNSQILGNVYSNGPIIGASNTRVFGDVYVAGATGFINDLKVFKSEPSAEDGNAHANTVNSCDIENGVYYQNIFNTFAAAYYEGSPDPLPEDLPVTEAQITNWKSDALNGGTRGSYSLESNEEDSLGPIKINGDFTMDSNTILTQTGTIWITGDIILDSNAVIQLASNYGSNSGIIIADGSIFLGSNVVICGSEGYDKSSQCFESLGSFLMFVSTNSSLSPLSPAIESTSNSQSAILYANQGMIKLDSNAALKEVTGYALYLDSKATVTYESGLANVNFTSGPAGGWEIVGWKEIE